MLAADSGLQELIQLYSEMRVHFNRVAKFFGEEPSSSQVDEFFGLFASFIGDFEVYLYNKELSYSSNY